MATEKISTENISSEFTDKTSNEHVSSQIPLNSKDDIVAELILICRYGLNVYSKYHTDDNCDICFDSLLDQYAFQYPCNPKHTFHRNCLLTNVLQYMKISCPTCGKFPKNI